MSERSSWLRVPRSGSPYVLDGLIAASLTVLSVAAFFTVERTPAQRSEVDVLGLALIAAATASVAFRRRWPIAVFVVVVGATVTMYLLDYPESGLPFVVLVALYTLAALGDRRVTVAATVALLGVIAFVIAEADDMDGGSLASALAIFAMAAVWGDGKQVREAYAEQLELRAAEKERERIEAARRAVEEERLRIARELHDVVAHAMGVVAVQSGVGAHVIDGRPDEAKRILGAISRTSRDSLNEMRRLLGVLRADPATAGAAAELAPTPGLGGLDELVDRVTTAGVPVETDIQGERAGLPIGVDLAAYRIVQEALTNVLKHAGRPGRAWRRATSRARSTSKWSATAGVRAPASWPATGWSACASGPPCTAARSPPAPVPAAATGWRQPCGTRRDPGPAGRRSGPRAGRLRRARRIGTDLEVVGEAANGQQAYEMAVTEQPDVALMDIRMPTLDGIGATNKIVADERTGGVRVLVLTTFDLDEYVFRALRAGASGFLLKDTQPTELLAAIRIVAAGDALLAPSITRTVIAEFANRPEPAANVDGTALRFLTDREREVLTLIGQGLSNGEITETLLIGAATTKTHVRSAIRCPSGSPGARTCR